ncbi:MAG: hypothetical protein ACI3XM_03565, partial [Eubacteriales bacterium]
FVQPISEAGTDLLSALPPYTLVLVYINNRACIRSATVYRESCDSDAQPDTVILRPWNPGYPVEIHGMSSITGIVRGWFAKPNELCCKSSLGTKTPMRNPIRNET